MLLIDGVKYKLWTPQYEVNDFQPIIKEHAKEIFGELSEYFDIKQKLETKFGKISIPEGFVVNFGKSSHWHIVEVELSKHDEYYHIGDQVNRFMNGIKNPESRKNILAAIWEDLKQDEVRKAQVKKLIDSDDIHEFLTRVIFDKPIVTIIVEDNRDNVKEAVENFNFKDVSDIKVIEFKTYVREGYDLKNAHAHLFDPLHTVTPQDRNSPPVKGITGNGGAITITFKAADIKWGRLDLGRKANISIFPSPNIPKKTTQHSKQFTVVTDYGECNGAYISKRRNGIYITKLEKIKGKDDLIGKQGTIEVIERMEKYRLKKA